jgi:hypothetical protein
MPRAAWKCHIGHCMFDPEDNEFMWVLDKTDTTGLTLVYWLRYEGDTVVARGTQHRDLLYIQRHADGRRVIHLDTDKFTDPDTRDPYRTRRGRRL